MESSRRPETIEQQYKMSWTAYIRPVVVLLIFIGVGIASMNIHPWLGRGVIGLWLIIFLIQVLTIRSLVLYTNEQGVWVYSGIFPWSKGMRGVKWRDVEDAVYYPSFFSWLLKSHTIRIGHRFTKASEITLPHIARGDQAVMHINEFHQSMLATFARGDES